MLVRSRSGLGSLCRLFGRRATIAETSSSTGPVVSMVAPASSASRASSASSCEASRPGGMKWSGRAASRASSTAGDGARCTKKSAGACSRNASRYRRLERRARDDGTLRSSRDGVAHQFEPRPAVFVVERHSRGHLPDVGGGMQVVGVDVSDVERRRQRLRDRRLARAGRRPSPPPEAAVEVALTSRGPCRRGAGCREGRPARRGTCPLHRRSVRRRDPGSRRGAGSRRSR